jgi:hypothetical protein
MEDIAWERLCGETEVDIASLGRLASRLSDDARPAFRSSFVPDSCLRSPNLTFCKEGAIHFFEEGFFPLCKDISTVSTLMLRSLLR